MAERMIVLKKVGFIGFGNMAEAIISGMISSGNYESEEIGAYDTDADKLNAGAEKLGFIAFDSNEKLVADCETVILAVKPIALQKALTPLRDVFCKANPLVISIAAGQSIERLKDLLGYDAKIVRVMPNINATALQAVSGYVSSENVTDDEEKTALKILTSFGTAVAVDEDKFSVYSAVAGCSPAYVYLFIDAIARVGVKYGLTKKDSLAIVTEAVISTISTDEKTDSEALDKVVLNAIDAAYNKDKGM